jgi:hypothetical protein
VSTNIRFASTNNLGQRHLKYTEAGSTIHNKPARKGRKKKKKKTLVLTLGSLPEKDVNDKEVMSVYPSVRRGPETQNRDFNRRIDA